MAWWYYAIIILAAGGIGFGLWKFFKRRKEETNSNEAVFYSGSLKDFAKEHRSSIKKLSELNPKLLIPYDYENRSKRDRLAISEKFYGKKIKIRSENQTSFGFQETNKSSSFDQSVLKEYEKPVETFIQPTNFGNNSELSSQLRQIEKTLIYEIQRVSSGYSSTNEINKLRNEKTKLENKLKELENDKKNSEFTQTQLHTEKSNLENTLRAANAETNRVQEQINELKEKVIAVEFLKSYSETVFAYMKYCQQVSNDAYSFFNKISQLNQRQSRAAGYLLIGFQSIINNIPIGSWMQIVEDISDSGVTNSKRIKSSFRMINDNEDKKLQFQKLLFSEVLTKYSSNILILAEAFKNISRFQGSSDLTSEAQNTFDKYVSEIMIKAKSIGLELKHVSLFESWEKYIGEIEDKGDERTLPYKDVEGLEKGVIAEIVSFGIKTYFEDTKTIIILA